MDEEFKLKNESQSQWEARMGKEILSFLRDEIYKDLRFMDVALSALTFVEREGMQMFATDGRMLYFGPEHTIEIFKKNERFLERAYLHSILHCIYGHLWIRQDRREDLWNLACDIAVEQVIDSLNKPCTKRILTLLRKQVYERLKNLNIVSASQIYELLYEDSKNFDPEEYIKWYQKLAREFVTDDHSFWPKKDNKQMSQRENDTYKDWQKRAKEISHNKSFSNSDDGGDIASINLAVEARRGVSYRDFLIKFSSLHEELKTNPDEFDLAFYSYGLRLYENIPLIEPLETKESNKIRDFIIAIDTSYSTSGQLVKNFLKKTLEILGQSENFFKNARVRIIQADDLVRDDIIINGDYNIEKLFSDFQLKGGGNTDFRPTFTYINNLIKMGEITSPDGVIYFTDGRGIFPQTKPEYKTAFVFLEGYEGKEEIKVPAWVYKEIIHKSTLEQDEKGNENGQFKTFTGKTKRSRGV